MRKIVYQVNQLTLLSNVYNTKKVFYILKIIIQGKRIDWDQIYKHKLFKDYFKVYLENT